MRHQVKSWSKCSLGFANIVLRNGQSNTLVLIMMVLTENSDSDLFQLSGKWHCELAMFAFGGLRLLLAHIILDTSKLCLHILAFLGVLPYFMPILRRFARSASTDHGQPMKVSNPSCLCNGRFLHILSRVLILATLFSTVGFEIIQ